MSSTADELELDSVVIRFGGEMGTKGDWTRRNYERRLLENIKSTLKRDKIVHSGFLRKHGRIYLKTSSVKEASSSLSKVFGISSVSPAIETASKLQDIILKSVSLARLTLMKGNAFAVKCKRVGDQPYHSHDVCSEVGRHILMELHELELSVNLGNPDVNIGIDIRDDCAFIYSSVAGGVGGLPLGTQPQVVCLLTDDMNSAVACWLAMKRGCPIVPVCFENSWSDEATIGRTRDIAKVLFEWAAGFPRKMYVVPDCQSFALIKDNCHKKLVPVLTKRLMYRIAERIAKMEKAEGIITGETIAEQPSQTLHILRLASTAAREYPVHRPLVGFDKNEIEEMAKKIGICQPSIKENDHTAVPDKLATRAHIVDAGNIAKAETEINIECLVEKSFGSPNIVIL